MKINLKYKQNYYNNKTLENLIKYVLNEIYVPIADYQNAVNIIRNENILFNSIQLKFIEIYLCYSQLHIESKYIQNNEINIKKLSDFDKSLFYYLLSIKPFSLSFEEKLNYLDCSISYNQSNVIVLLDRAKLENNLSKKQKLIKMARNSVKRVDSVNVLELQDENLIYNIGYYINSEILNNILNEVQMEILFPSFSDIIQ